MTEQPRTLKQNSSFHAWLTEYSDELNSQGTDMRAIVSDDVVIPVTKENLHYLFNRLANAMYPREDGEDNSSSRLTTKQFVHVCDVLQHTIGERTGVGVDFPSVERAFEEKRLQE